MFLLYPAIARTGPAHSLTSLRIPWLGYLELFGFSTESVDDCGQFGSNLFAALIWFRRPVNPLGVLCFAVRCAHVLKYLAGPAERIFEAMADC
jgi:hypothetical protein